MRFKIDDRVVAIKPFDNNSDIIGKTGTIKRVWNLFYAVEYDEIIKRGHTCGGLCIQGHGWDTDDKSLRLANINKRIEYKER